ncbi:hypothetical protein ACG2F4_08650 [Halalkalibaculum sp. DA3122]|uniref:hypothetical protein n=1 Tax=unclassified Halalkalibaculum TaxID=2964617 RepID=UPI003754167A
MPWLKDVLVDITVTLFIFAAVFLDTSWMRWIIIGYTALMVLVKSVVLAGDRSLQLIRKTKTEAPGWLFNLLYAVNTGVLLYGSWWYTATGWLVIWILSYLAQRKLKEAQGKA